MSMHMRLCIKASVLVCFACTSSALRTQALSEELPDRASNLKSHVALSLHSTRQAHSKPAIPSFNVLAALLRALSSTAAFNQVGVGKLPVFGNRGASQSPIMGSTRLLEQQLNEMEDDLSAGRLSMKAIQDEFEEEGITEPMNPHGMPVWLDLRGVDNRDDVDKLINLYEAMNKRFKKMRRRPGGRAVSGVLKYIQEVDAIEFEEGEMLGVAVDKEDGAVLVGGNGTERVAGKFLKASFEDYPSQREVALASIQRPDEYLILEGGSQDMLPLLNFALNSAKDLPDTSKPPLILVQVQTHKDLKALTQVKLERDADSSNMALFLRPVESMWFQALTGKKDILTAAGKSVKHGAGAAKRGRQREQKAAGGFR